MTITVTPYVAGDDALSFTDTAKITGNFNSTTGVLTLSGTDTAADYQAALRTVLYINHNTVNPAHERTLVYSIAGDSVDAARLIRLDVVAQSCC